MRSHLNMWLMLAAIVAFMAYAIVTMLLAPV
ncbi:MAG: hypothetical protein HLUCCA12_12895 [Rhodobacteraceae bacterium HLUCCA12]|nr:MAG: hypothetical protein HLUCCA12_12895 [Rhodobacteraceae bacterium HLUCCA12]